METQRSRTLFNDAREVIPGGVNSPVRAFRAVGGNPLFISKGKGSKIYDADGNSYIDYVLSWGPLILGHAPSRVVKALCRQAALGTSFGAPTALEIELAGLLVRAFPSMQKVRLVNSGTEATMSAIRVARGATGRDKIIKFEGCPLGRDHRHYVGPSAVGPYREPPADDFAQAGHVGLDAEALLGALRSLTRKYGSILIFDEVMTGFRVSYGGAQERFGIKPDMTCLGKVIGGGLPVGAYGGRADIMAMVSPEGPVYQAGTLSGNPLAMTAGIETIKAISGKGSYERLLEKAGTLEEALRDAASRAGARTKFYRAGTMFCTYFTDREVKDYATATSADTKKFGMFFMGMLRRGVNIAPSQFEAGFISLAHSLADIDRTAKAAYEAFLEIER
ncbi:MAG: aminotransferase class III-fold pyridoxal phosphate-dependent enzyme [Nitrospirota bacterium]